MESLGLPGWDCQGLAVERRLGWGCPPEMGWGCQGFEMERRLGLGCPPGMGWSCQG